MADKTFYSLLEIPQTATAAEIRTAYRRLMMDVHPDRLANVPAYWQRQAEERAKEINEAFAVLSNPEMRRLYNLRLAVLRRGSAGAGYYRPAPNANGAGHYHATSGPSAESKRPRRTSAHSFKSKLTPSRRLFFAAVPALFGAGVAFGVWESNSSGEELVLFLMSASLLFAIACLFQGKISHFLAAFRVRTARQRLSSIVVAIAILLIGGRLFYISNSSNAVSQVLASKPMATPASPSDKSPIVKSSSAPGVAWIIPMSLPNGTEIFSRRRIGGYGKFEVDNGTALDAVVELVDTSTKRAIRAFYVESGQRFSEDRISPGTYSIYYMTGADWNASTKVFNRVAELGVFDETAAFAGEIDFHVFSITLHGVEGGNAKTSSLDADEFKRAMIPYDSQ